MLGGCRVLLVEDEFMLAQEFQHELEAAGAVVLGPEPSVHRGLARIHDATDRRCRSGRQSGRRTGTLGG